MQKEPFYPNQVIPLLLTAIVAVIGMAVLFGEIHLLNILLPGREAIIPQLRLQDIGIGMTIYLKTAIDFAIFIGRLMDKHPGWKNRVMIEIGSALGNIAGTLAVLLLWDLFREIKILMAIMIIIAGLVLLRLAEEGLEHVKNKNGKFIINAAGTTTLLAQGLHAINRFFAPLLNKIIPHPNTQAEGKTSYWQLFLLACTVPFVLGLDDFAGYIPLFNIVNVMGFATGVFLGHMILNIALFASPKITISLVRNPLISLLGSIAFIGIAIWGLVEAWHLLSSIIGI